MKKLIVIMLMLLLSVGISTAQENEGTVDIGGEYSFGWLANTEPDLAGYRIYKRSATGSYTYGAENAIGEYGLVTESDRFTGHSEGIYYFVLTAFDESGLESGPSNEVMITVINLPPSAPTGCVTFTF